MRDRRPNKLLIEPPASATGDIAFNLIVFFLVCAAVQPNSGRSQAIPKADESEQEQKEDDLVVELKRDPSFVLLNGNPIRTADFAARLKPRLANKPRPEDRIVVFKSDDDVPFDHWINISLLIEDAGGIVTLQIEEEQTVAVP